MPSEEAKLIVKFEAENKKLHSELARTTKKLNRFEKGAKKNVSNVARSFKVALGGIALGSFVAKVFRMSASIESLRARLETVEGSATKAAKSFDLIKQFAETTPFRLEEVVDSFIKLKALGLDPSERALLSYGNTASAMGKTLNQLIEAVADAATGEFERLKEFGIKAKSEGDKVTFTFQGIETTVQKSANAIQGYILGIGEAQFAGSMERQAKTVAGAFSTLSDNFNLLFNSNEGMADLSGSIKDMSDALKDPDVVSGAQSIASAIIRMASAATTIATATPGFLNFLSLQLKNSLFGADATGDIVFIDQAIVKLTKRLEELQSKDFSKNIRAAAVTANEIKKITFEIERLRGVRQRLINERAGTPPAFVVNKGNDISDVPAVVVDTKAQEKFDKLINNIVKNSFPALERQLTKVREEMLLLNIAMGEAAPEAAKEMEAALIRLQGREKDLVDEIAEGSDQMSKFAERAAENMQDAFANFLFDPFDNGVDGMVKGFANALKRMIAEAAAAQIFEALGIQRFLGATVSGGGGGGLGGLLQKGLSIASSFTGFGGTPALNTGVPVVDLNPPGAVPIPGFAHGGRPNPNQLSMVGENGPELFIPDGVRGTIVPNGQFGNQFTNHFNFPGVTNEKEARHAGGAAAREFNRLIETSARFA